MPKIKTSTIREQIVERSTKSILQQQNTDDSQFLLLTKDSTHSIQKSGNFALSVNEDAGWASFVPDHILAADLDVTEEHQLALPVCTEYQDAVFVLLDLSGFTKLTRELLLQDASPSWIGQIIQGSLGKVIDLIVASGGDVAKFSGDAVMAVWNRQDDSLTSALKRAILCCIKAMISVQKSSILMPKGQAVTLSLHGVLHFGSATNIILGLPDKRLDSVWVGSACVTLSESLLQANKNELILTDCVCDHLQSEQIFLKRKILVTKETNLQSFIQLKNEESINSSLPVVLTLECPRQQLLQQAVSKGPNCSKSLFLDPSIMARVPKSGHFVDMTELRSVTVLFVKLHPNVEPDWRDPATVNLLAYDLQDVVSAGLTTCDKLGVFRQINVDEKGITMFMVFGLPPTTHESTALPAVQCALQFQRRFEEYGLDRNAFKMALASGRIFSGVVGTFGSLCRLEHALLGDALNLAARLMDSDGALNEILCDQSTFEQLHSYGRYECVPSETLKLKGFENPVTVWHIKNVDDVTSPADGVKAKRSFRTEGIQFHAAEDEEEWKTEFNQWRYHSKPCTILIEGCSGSGKSTLAGRIQEYARNAKTLIWTLCSYEYESTSPMHTIRQLDQHLIDIVEQCLELKESFNKSFHAFQTKEKLGIIMKFLSEDTVLCFQALEKLEEIVTNSTGEHSGGANSLATSVTVARKQRPEFSMESNVALVEDFVVRILNKITEKYCPLMIVMDDCQWQDAFSWQLSSKIMDLCPKVLTLLLSRPVSEYTDPKPFESVIQKKSTFHRKVNDVSKERISTILGKYFQQIPMKQIEEVSQSLYERSGGNAFAVDVLLRQIIETGNFNVPKDTTAVFVAQYDHLRKDFQNFLQVACLIGQVFYAKDVALLSHFEYENDATLHDTINSMDRFSFLVSLDKTQSLWKFRHCLIVEQIYQMTPEKTLQAKHLEVAQFYVTLRKTSTSHRRLEMLPLIHKQFILAKENSMSFKYSLKLMAAHLRLQLYNNVIHTYTEHVQKNRLLDSLEPLTRAKVFLEVVQSLRYIGNNDSLVGELVPKIMSDLGLKIPSGQLTAMIRFIQAMTENLAYWTKGKMPSIQLSNEVDPVRSIQYIVQLNFSITQIYGGWGQLLTFIIPYNLCIRYLYLPEKNELLRCMLTVQNAIFLFGSGNFDAFEVTMKRLGFGSLDPATDKVVSVIRYQKTEDPLQKTHIFAAMNSRHMVSMMILYAVSMSLLHYVDLRLCKFYANAVKPDINDTMGYLREDYMQNLSTWSISLQFHYDKAIDQQLMEHMLAMRRAEEGDKTDSRVAIDSKILILQSAAYLIIIRGYFWAPQYQNLVMYMREWGRQVFPQLMNRKLSRGHCLNMHLSLYSMTLGTEMHSLGCAFDFYHDKITRDWDISNIRLNVSGPFLMIATSVVNLTLYWPFSVRVVKDSFEVDSLFLNDTQKLEHEETIKKAIRCLEFCKKISSDRSWLKRCPFIFSCHYFTTGLLHLIQNRYTQAYTNFEKCLKSKVEEQARTFFAMTHQLLFYSYSQKYIQLMSSQKQPSSTLLCIFKKSEIESTQDLKKKAQYYYEKAIHYYDQCELLWLSKNMRRLRKEKYEVVFE